MELKDFLVLALNKKTPYVELPTYVSDITIDTLIKSASKITGVKVAFSITRKIDSVIVKFTYLTEEAAPKNKTTYYGRSSTPAPGKKKVADQSYHIMDRGGLSFLYDIDVRKGNVVYVHTYNIENVFRVLNDHLFLLIGLSEGVIAYRAEYFEGDNPGEMVVEIRLEIQMDYSEFIDRIEQAEKKAKEIYKNITGGASLPPEIICLLAYTYMQRNTTYDHPYVDRLTSYNAQIINNHTSYGSLCLKKAVCEGYSWGLIKILRAAGLEAVPVTGNHSGSGHEWTKVKINGQWYNMDCTIDAQKEGVIIGPFLCSDDLLRRNGYDFNSYNHIASDKKYDSDIGIQNLVGEFIANAANYVIKGVDSIFFTYDYYRMALR